MILKGLQRIGMGAVNGVNERLLNPCKGHYREEHLFVLRQTVELYDTYTAQILVCDEAIERQLKRFDTQGDPQQLPTSKKQRSANTPAFDVRSELYRMSGVDLTRIDGVSDLITLKVLSETGMDMSRWKSEKQFASWAESWQQGIWWQDPQ